MAQYSDFSTLIKSKGDKAMADVLGKSELHVRVMRSRNHISRLNWPQLLLGFPELGMNDLLDMEKSSPPKSAPGDGGNAPKPQN